MDRRAFIQTGIALGTSGLTACAVLTEKGYDAVVSRKSSARSGATFSTVQAAIDKAPAVSNKPFRIFIDIGRWREKLVIDKPFIYLIGASRTETVLSFDAYAGQIATDGQPWGTLRSATVSVRLPDFSASNLTIENAFDYLGYLSRVQGEPTGANRAQAVALSLDAASDRALLRDVNILGYQDTLLTNAGRSLFRHCKVAGTVDFIFGAGNAVFEGCQIVSRWRQGQTKQGYIAAPSTLLAHNYGLTFIECHLTRERGVPVNSVSLGRAWRPTTTFNDGRYGNPNAVGLAAFVRCWMDDHIEAQGWDSMEYGARDGSRVALEPQDARLFEYESRGPGASKASHPRRRMMTAAEAKRFNVNTVLGDWSVR